MALPRLEPYLLWLCLARLPPLMTTVFWATGEPELPTTPIGYAEELSMGPTDWPFSAPFELLDCIYFL